MSLLGWHVQWDSSFRSYQGTVVATNDSQLIIYSFEDLEKYDVSKNERIRKVSPNCEGYMRYILDTSTRCIDFESSELCLSSELEKLSTADPIMKIAKDQRIKGVVT